MEKKVTVATSETLVVNKETAEHRTGLMRDTFTALLSDWFLIKVKWFLNQYTEKEKTEGSVYWSYSTQQVLDLPKNI